MKKTKHVICVAKYSETTDWIEHFRDIPDTYVVIYDKMTTYPNVGREAETFLRCILDVYDHLDSITHVTLLQGHPFDHVDLTTIVDSVRSNPSNIVPLGRLHLSDATGNPDHPGLPVEERWQRLGFAPLRKTEGWVFAAGAQYTVPSSVLARVPKSVWLRMHRAVTDGTVCAWTMERYWLMLLRDFESK